MILESLKYTRSKGLPKEWAIVGCDGNQVTFGNINLVVGKNAAGKSRTLTVIKEISGLLSGTLKVSNISYANMSYQLKWVDERNVYEYFLETESHSVKNEKLTLNGESRLERDKRLIYSESSKKMEPLTIEEHLLSVVLHDPVNYPFLEVLYQWGTTLKLGPFTNQIEKNYILDDISRLKTSFEVSSSSPVYLLHTFWTGKHLYGKAFVDAVKSSMKMLQYPIEMIDIMEGTGGYSIFVKEDELDEMTSQTEMSQGMYRALSFVIHLNLAILSKLSVCILVDDLGEGLDFDRSRLLIDLLVKKINDSNIQIFITTNDRYVMNKLPLRFWSVIERYPKKSVFYNYYNSKAIFDDFKFTGLNNFDFLATDFYLKGFGEADE